MTFRSWSAIGIGTSLGLLFAHSYSANAEQPAVRHPYPANAEQPAVRHHFARAGHHHESRQRIAAARAAKAAKAEKETKALSSLKNDMRDLRRQVVEVETLRRELTDLKEKILGPTPLPLSLSVLPRPQSPAVVEPKQVTLKLPDFSEPLRPRAPVNPATASLPVAIEERAAQALKAKSAVEEAKAYLIETATPGYTMVRQGVPVAIGRLHPEFVVKLAAAVKLARESGMTDAGVFSAYRPPAFGVGGFSDKFNSLHSYGLAADLTGIGEAGSRFARLWQGIVRRVGLFLPYGPNNHAEFNHTQLVPTKKAPGFLRKTITASEPKDLQKMWLASGVTSYVGEVTASFARPPALASATSAQPAAPAVDWQLPIPPPPGQRTAPRATRPRQTGKRGAPRRGRLTGGKGRVARAGCRRAPRDLDWMREVLTSS
jgi:hypothetical protein